MQSRLFRMEKGGRMTKIVIEMVADSQRSSEAGKGATGGGK